MTGLPRAGFELMDRVLREGRPLARRVATPAERHQTKQVVFGVVACVLLIVLLDLVILFLSYNLPDAPFELSSLLLKPWSTLPVLVLDLSFLFAIYRYRLWDTDLYINRTLVYGLVTIFLAAMWFVTTRVLNYASQQFLGKQISWLGALISSLPAVASIKPVQQWVEKWINSHFYKDRIDYSEALIELKPELATYDCGSMNWMNNALLINHPHFLEKLGRTMTENGVRPEIEVFDTGHLAQNVGNHPSAAYGG